MMPGMGNARMQAVIDRVAMVERVDNGLIVRYREPVETKVGMPPSLPFPGPGSFQERTHGETWKHPEKDDPSPEEATVWVLEMRAAYCADEEAALPVLRRARELNEQIRDLRREGKIVHEGDDGGLYGVCA